MSQTHTSTQTDPVEDQADMGEPNTTETVETHPTLKPTMISLITAVLVGGGIIGYLLTTPDLLGSVERTEIVANVVVLLTVIVAGRLALRLYILTQTRYVVTADAVRREYSLLYKEVSRELPLEQLRSHELRRSRLEALLGIGSVAFLTGSITESPTHLKFENVPDPERMRRHVRDRLPGNA